MLQRGHGEPAVEAPRPLRCLLTWLAVTSCLALLLRVCADVLTAPLLTPPSADEVLVRGAALAVLLCLPPTWWASTHTCWQVARGTWDGVPTGLVRRAVLVACGGAIVLGGLSPAHAGGPEGGDATSQQTLHGLPLPDLPTVDDRDRTPRRYVPPAGGPGPRVGAGPRHRVLRGESLWTIAEAQLPPTSDDAAVAALWRRIHAANTEVLGPDPDLIHPGQSLRLPGTRDGAITTHTPAGRSGPSDRTNHEGNRS